MKYLVILFFLCSGYIYAQEFPAKPTNYITDEADILSDSEESLLNTKLRGLEDSTTNQLFIYIAASLNGNNLETFSQDLFKAWKVGQDEKNNGILITIFVDDHKFRIQTGYGLEGALPDLLTKHIQDNDMRPSFKNQNYYEGIDKGVDKLIYYSKHEFNPADLDDAPWGILVFFYVFAAVFLMITLLLAKGIKDRSTAKKAVIIISIILFLTPVIGAFLLIIMLFVALSMRKDLLKSKNGNTGSYYSDSSSWSSSSSDSSSSSSFDGGGGGDSGGGGSSSDW